MKKRDNRNIKIFILILLGLILISFLANVIIAADGAGTSTVNKPLSESKAWAWIKEHWTSFWTGWEQGGESFDKVMIKYLLLIIIIFFIYAILEMLTFPNGVFLRLVLSLIIGFLATIYITPNEAWALAQSYSALGITIGAIIPFIILVGFTIITVTHAAKSNTGMEFFFQYIGWVVFAIVMVVRTFLLFAQGVPSIDASGATVYNSLGGNEGFILILMSAISITAVVMVFWNGQIRKFILRQWFKNLDIETKRTIKTTLIGQKAYVELGREIIEEGSSKTSKGR